MLLVFDTGWNTWWHQVSTDVSFSLKVVGSTSADEEISQLLPELEKLKEEAWVRFMKWKNKWNMLLSIT